MISNNNFLQETGSTILWPESPVDFSIALIGVERFVQRILNTFSAPERNWHYTLQDFCVRRQFDQPKSSYTGAPGYCLVKVRRIHLQRRMHLGLAKHVLLETIQFHSYPSINVSCTCFSIGIGDYDWKSTFPHRMYLE